MKRFVSLLLVFCFCVGLAACGKSNASSASPSADASPATPTESAAPSAQPAPTAEPTAEPVNLQELVDALNAEEQAQRTADDPSVGVFEVANTANTINYKFAMSIFQYVIMMAQAGDAENLNAYNRLLNSLPPLEASLENALHESQPGLNVVVYLMSDEYSNEVAAVVENGAIIYDLVNGVGTAPKDITPILESQELPPEVQEKLDEMKNSLNQNG